MEIKKDGRKTVYDTTKGKEKKEVKKSTKEVDNGKK